jgi:hypothetical protein
LKFICQDSYEAEKFSSIFSYNKDNSLFVKQIANIIDNEVIVNLNDGSHHSISFKDKNNAILLKNWFPYICLNVSKIEFTEFSGDEAIINFK